MIDSPQVISLPAVEGKTLQIRANQTDNWSEVLEFKIGDEVSLIKKRDLYGIMFVFADEETQEQLMPVRHTTIRKYIKQHRVRAKKDIKAGEEVVINCEVDVPLTVEEGFKGWFNRRIKSRFSI